MINIRPTKLVIYVLDMNFVLNGTRLVNFFRFINVLRNEILAIEREEKSHKLTQRTVCNLRRRYL